MIAADFHVEPANWTTDADALRAVRDRVFIDEQRVPEADEHDPWDVLARHVIARDDNGEPIGTGRLVPPREEGAIPASIGRMAVLAGWRGRGVGTAVLRVLLEQAREARYPEVTLHAQSHALEFYAKAGFTAYGDEFDECGIRHRSMRLGLEPAFVPRPASASTRPEARILPMESFAGARAALRELLGNARHELAVMSHDLDPLLFDDADALSAVQRIALSGRRARIRIIVREPRRPVQDGHRLVTLAQRLTSAIALRVPVENADLEYPSAFVLDDRGGFQFRPLAGRPEGEAMTSGPARHAELLRLFDAMWERSEPCEETRQIAL